MVYDTMVFPEPYVAFAEWVSAPGWWVIWVFAADAQILAAAEGEEEGE